MGCQPWMGGLQPSSAFANVQPSCELTAVYDRARLISHWLPLGHLDPSANVQGSWCSLCFNFLVGDSHRFLPNQKHGRIKESSVWWTACGQNCKHQRRMIKLRRESFFCRLREVADLRGGQPCIKPLSPWSNLIVTAKKCLKRVGVVCLFVCTVDPGWKMLKTNASLLVSNHCHCHSPPIKADTSRQ